MKNTPWSLRADPEFFTRATSHGNRVFVVFWEKALKPPTINVIVPKTTSIKAVVRNKLKRQVKSLLSQEKSLPKTLVIVVKRPAVGLSFAEITSNLVHVLGKI